MVFLTAQADAWHKVAARQAAIPAFAITIIS